MILWCVCVIVWMGRSCTMWFVWKFCPHVMWPLAILLINNQAPTIFCLLCMINNQACQWTGNFLFAQQNNIITAERCGSSLLLVELNHPLWVCRPLWENDPIISLWPKKSNTYLRNSTKLWALVFIIIIIIILIFGQKR